MNDALGLLLFVLFILVILGTAAGVTWIVVRLSPPKRPDATPKA
jgi:NhaP-type Na+/H+ or K+/H+ antiporter